MIPFNGVPDPFELKELLWPYYLIYDKQAEIIISTENNPETIVVAANMMGKDWVAGLIVIIKYIRAIFAGKSCRVVTTSVRDDHLRVLWGEIGRFISDSKYPLTADKGGPLIVNHRDIRYSWEGVNGYSYVRGMVSEKGEGMAGHHADWTLGVIDEASGVDDEVYTQMSTWAKRILMFGNANPCHNMFYKAVNEGDKLLEV